MYYISFGSVNWCSTLVAGLRLRGIFWRPAAATEKHHHQQQQQQQQRMETTLYTKITSFSISNSNNNFFFCFSRYYTIHEMRYIGLYVWPNYKSCFSLFWFGSLINFGFFFFLILSKHKCLARVSIFVSIITLFRSQNLVFYIFTKYLMCCMNASTVFTAICIFFW